MYQTWMSGGKLNPGRITQPYCTVYIGQRVPGLGLDGACARLIRFNRGRAEAMWPYRSKRTKPYPITIIIVFSNLPSHPLSLRMFLFSQFKENDSATSHGGQNSMWQDRQLVKPFQDDKRHRCVKH